MKFHAEVQDGDIVLSEIKNSPLYAGLRHKNCLSSGQRQSMSNKTGVLSVVVDGDVQLTKQLSNLTQLTLAVRTIRDKATVVLDTAHQDAPRSPTKMKQVYPPSESITGDDIAAWLEDPSDVGNEKYANIAPTPSKDEEHFLTSTNPPPL